MILFTSRSLNMLSDACLRPKHYIKRLSGIYVEFYRSLLCFHSRRQAKIEAAVTEDQWRRQADDNLRRQVVMRSLAEIL